MRAQGFEFVLPATSKENFALRDMLQAAKLDSAWLPLIGVHAADTSWRHTTETQADICPACTVCEATNAMLYELQRLSNETVAPVDMCRPGLETAYRQRHDHAVTCRCKSKLHDIEMGGFARVSAASAGCIILGVL